MYRTMIGDSVNSKTQFDMHIVGLGCREVFIGLDEMGKLGACACIFTISGRPAKHDRGVCVCP